jgi:hypothetical protein
MGVKWGPREEAERDTGYAYTDLPRLLGEIQKEHDKENS